MQRFMDVTLDYSSTKFAVILIPTRVILFGLPHPVLRPEVFQWSLPVLSMVPTLNLYPVLRVAYSRVLACPYPILTLVLNRLCHTDLSLDSPSPYPVLNDPSLSPASHLSHPRICRLQVINPPWVRTG